MTWGVSSTGMQQGMRQSMMATAAMQLFMRALQASGMELTELISQALASNPTLEELPPPAEEAASDSGATQRHDFFMESLTEQKSLHSFLEEQIHQSALPPAEEQAALALIPYLDHRGFFAEPPQQVAKELGLTEKIFRRALHILQDLEPAGVGAADLRESLILQLQRLGEQGGIPMRLLQQRWEDLVRHRYAEAARALNLEEEAVRLAACRIARLNPDPGSGFSRAELNVITPDILVETKGEEISVTLTGQKIPRLTLSSDYRDMMAERADNPELRRYLSRCFREGRELIKALQDRQSTILAVAKAITLRQKDFFLRGPSCLHPLKMEEIAADTGLSVSTISRACRGKYLKCPHGVYELRSFFTGSLPMDGEQEGLSAGNIQARLRALVNSEDPAKPLSDARLETLLAAEGISVARRTIAKYREQMKILPASLRRRR